MSDAGLSQVEGRNGFDLLRCRLDAEYRDNIATAEEMGSLTTLAALEQTYPRIIAQVTAAEAELAAFYEMSGRKIGEVIITACIQDNVSDDDLVALAKEITFRVGNSVAIKDIVDEMFVSQPQDETFLVDPEGASSLARNGLSYSVAEYLDLM